MGRFATCGFLALVLAVGVLSLRASAADTKPADPDEEILRQAGVATDTESIVAMLRRVAANEARARGAGKLIHKLGSDDFAVREKASADLRALGQWANDALYKATNNPDQEIARRAKECHAAVKKTKTPPEKDSRVRMAALHLLVRRGHCEGLTELYVAALLSPDENVSGDASYILEKAVQATTGSFHEPIPDDLARLRTHAQAIVDTLIERSRSDDETLKLAALRVFEKWGTADLRRDQERFAKAATLKARTHALALLDYPMLANQESPLLLEALGDKDLTVRASAAGSLGAMMVASRVVVPALVKALDDPEPEVAKAALDALGRIGVQAEEAIPAVIKKLKHGEARYRYACAYNLGLIGAAKPEAVMPAILEAFKDPEGARGAVWAVGFIGAPAKEAIPLLIDMLKDGAFDYSKDHRSAIEIQHRGALRTLARFGADAKAAVSIMGKIVADKTKPEGLRYDAALMLGEMGPLAKPAVPALIKVVREDTPRPKDGNLGLTAFNALEKIDPVAAGKAWPPSVRPKIPPMVPPGTPPPTAP